MATPAGEQKPGAGVDRTLIRRLLQLTPAERLKLLVEEVRKLAERDDQWRAR
jgi:hypothetical protein